MSRFPALAATRRGVLLVVIVLVAALGVAVLLAERPTERGDSPGGSATTAEPATTSMPEPALDAAAPPAKEFATPQVDDAAVMERDATAIAGGGDAASISPVGPEGGAGDALPAPDIDARIVRTGSIQLRLREGGFEDGWSDAQAVAGAFGGYVVSASRSGAGDGPRVGTITMRVPSARFDAAVDRLRGMDRTKVERLDVASQDVTQEFVDVRSRLRHDRAVEGRLLALLAETDGVSEVLAVQSRLDQVQEQIEVNRGRLQYLEKLTSMSTIEVTLREPGAKGGADDDDAVLGEAWGDARERFAETVAGAVVWTGGALPVLLLLALATVVGRVLWRRRRPSHAPGNTPESTS